MNLKSTFLALSLAALAPLALAQNPSAPVPAPLPRPGEPAQPMEKRADLSGRVTAVAPDGKSLTLSMPARPSPDGQPPAPDARGQQATVNLTDHTQLLFFGVGDGQAIPTPGMMAMVWLDDTAKDTAARVRFMKREGEDRPDVQGRVLAVSPDGRTVTVETRGEGSDRPVGKIDLHLANYTQALYYGVDRGGAKPTPDYLVVAWLEKGSRDTPARIRFMKNDPRDQAPQPPR